MLRLARYVRVHFRMFVVILVYSAKGNVGENVEFFNFKLDCAHSDTFSFKYVIGLLIYYYYYYFIKLFRLCLLHLLPYKRKFVVQTVKDSFNFERN